MTEQTEQPVVLPLEPYRGLEPFRYCDRCIFFARAAEVRALVRAIVKYRGVILYGESGAGKSSLLTAGVIPAILDEGLRVDRVRVQNRPGGELVVERTPTTPEPGPPYIPSIFADQSDDRRQIVLPLDAFTAMVDEAARLVDQPQPLLIFDQFEEIVTLFDPRADLQGEASGRTVQAQIVDRITEMLRRDGPGPKLVLSFCEDYLARLLVLFRRVPDLVDHGLRLAAPNSSVVEHIIFGPFERWPNRFGHAFTPDLAALLATQLRAEHGDDVSLSELQVACLELWRSDDPSDRLERRGVRGLVEDHLDRALAPAIEIRAAQESVLSLLVTASGGRNIVSAEDLLGRLAQSGLSEPHTRSAVESLRTGRVIVREVRNEVSFLEIASEFLVPWIRGLRERRLGEQMRKAQSRDLAAASIAQLHVDPEVALLVAVEAAKISRTGEARAALQRALESSRVRALLHAGAGLLKSVKFSPSGDRLVTVHADGHARLWDVRPSELPRAVLIMSWPAIAVAYRPDEQVIAVSGPERTISLLDLQRGEKLAEWPVDVEMTDLTFSPGGDLLAATGRTCDAFVCSITGTGGRIEARLAHAGPVLAIAFDPRGRLMATGSGEPSSRVQLWRTGEWSLMSQVLDDKAGEVWGLAFGPDGMLAAACFDGTARLWELELHPPLYGSPRGGTPELKVLERAVLRHPESVSAVCFTPQGDRLATACFDGAARLWYVRTGTELASLLGHTARVMDVDFSPDGALLVSASADTTARVWASNDERSALQLRHTRGVNGAAFDPRGRWILTGAGDGLAYLWNADNGATEGLLGRHEADIWRLEFAPSGEFVATASVDRTAAVWNVAHRQRLASLSGHGAEVTAASFSPDERSMATSSFDRTVRLWDLRAPAEPERVIRGHAGKVIDVTFSPDGALLASAALDSTVRIWSRNADKEIACLRHDDWVGGVAFSPDGRMLATTGWDQRARIWETGTWSLVAILEGHSRRVRNASFSPDGRWLVTASADCTANVWDATSWTVVNTLCGHTAPVNSATFSPDSTRVVTASHDGMARVFLREVEQSVDVLLERAASRITRSLTDVERRRYLHEKLRPDRAESEADR